MYRTRCRVRGKRTLTKGDLRSSKKSAMALAKGISTAPKFVQCCVDEGYKVGSVYRSKKHVRCFKAGKPSARIVKRRVKT